MNNNKNLFMLLVLTCIVGNLFAQSNVFNFYQPQNYASPGQNNRFIKNLQVKVDQNSGTITSDELTPISSTYPFTGIPHGGVIVNNNLIVSCAANGFTGLSSFNTTTGQNINNKQLANTGELIDASNIYNFYTTHTNFKNGSKIDSVSCINRNDFSVKWAKELTRNGKNGVVGQYIISDLLLMVGLIDNNVSSIVAFEPTNGSSITVNNDGFTFTSSFRVVSGPNNTGYIVAYLGNTIQIAQYSLVINTDKKIEQINITKLNHGYIAANSQALYAKYIGKTSGYPNGYLRVYTCDNGGLFTRILFDLSNNNNIPSTIQLNTQGEPYDIIERQTTINEVTQNIVFVARTSSDNTASDVAIIPELSQPIIGYFGFNRQATGLIIVN